MNIEEPAIKAFCSVVLLSGKVISYASESVKISVIKLLGNFKICDRERHIKKMNWLNERSNRGSIVSTVPPNHYRLFNDQ